MSSGSKGERMDSLLKNIKTGRGGFAKKNEELEKIAMEGKNPCERCTAKRTAAGYCTMSNCCLPWYRYFQFKWKRLQKAMIGR